LKKKKKSWSRGEKKKGTLEIHPANLRAGELVQNQQKLGGQKTGGTEHQNWKKERKRKT